MSATQIRSRPFSISHVAHFPYEVDRLGELMHPRSGDPREAEGVLNPACARGQDGELYIYPREVSAGNRSVVGMARVRFGKDGNPFGVEREGVVLEPEEPYEYVSGTIYGCEDPRISYIQELERYVMTYVATTPRGPRIALAVSDDAKRWERMGLVDFLLEGDVDLNEYSNKDAVLFPEPVTGPLGRPALALLHRPMYALLLGLRDVVKLAPPARVRDDRESIWISYIDLEAVRADLSALTRCTQHQIVAAPVANWEQVKIGAGTPPLRTHLGWVLLYHGVCQDGQSVAAADPSGKHLRYSAGALVLDRDDPRKVIYRSPEPILDPSTPQEQHGIVANVVFPTGLDPRGRCEPGSRVDVYYGMADTRVGVGCFTLPESLPQR